MRRLRDVGRRCSRCRCRSPTTRSPRASTRRCARPASAPDGARGVHPHPGHPRRRRAHLRSGRLPDAVGRRHRQAARRSAAGGLRDAASRWRWSTIVRNHPGLGEPADQVEQPAEQRAGDAGGGPARRVRRRDAELPRRAGRVHDVEPVHRQGRRRADAAARRRPAGRHHARVPVRGRRRRSASPFASRCCGTTTCSAPTKRSSPARRARSCRSCTVDDRTIGSGTSGPGDAARCSSGSGSRRAERHGRPVERTSSRLPITPGRESGLEPTSTSRLRTPRPAGTSTSGCGRRTGCRCGRRVGQNLLRADERQRKRRLLARVRVRPVVGRRPPPRCAARSSARCPSGRPCRRSTAWISRADRDHRVAEAIELLLRLALGRLDHQRAGTGNDTVGAWKP